MVYTASSYTQDFKITSILTLVMEEGSLAMVFSTMDKEAKLEVSFSLRGKAKCTLVNLVQCETSY